MTPLIFQPSHTYEQALDRAARLWGIEPEYGDTWGKLHVTTAETKQRILAALGVGTGSLEELDRDVERRLWDQWNRLLPPVAVLGESGRASGFSLQVPSTVAEGSALVRFHWEGGHSEQQEYRLDELKSTGRAELRGCVFLRKAVPLPAGAPLGYHDVEVTLAQGQAQMRLIVCPDRAYEPPALRNGGRAAGLAIALYGLRSARNWGCGDFTDLQTLADWLAEDVGASFIGLNPLHAIPNRQPFNVSPYLASSVFYKNPIYLDIERVDGFEACRRARQLVASTAFQAELDHLRSSQYVEYERVDSLKTRVLMMVFVSFLREWRRETPRALEFRAYLDEQGSTLDRYATWRALEEWIHHCRPNVWVWPHWPDGYRDPCSEETRAFTKKHWRRVLFHKWVQWQVDRQLWAAQEHAARRGLAIGLYHDLALATDPCGADLWAHRPFYVSGCRVGAPPDNFSPKGQDWAFAPPNAERHREDGYRLFAESIRKNCRAAGALRIDHVMRFFRLYWIPDQMDPTRGAYVQDHYEELLHIVALESVRNRVVIIGEDLGTVTDKIREALDRFGLLGYKVPYFEKDRNGQFRPPQEYSPRALVASSTHDLPTLAGFWLGRDIEARRSAGLFKTDAGYREAWEERGREKQKLLDALFALNLLPSWAERRAERFPELTGELHYALIGWLALASSQVMVVNQEDLVKETDQQNLPATIDEQYPNWRRKTRFTMEQLRDAHAGRDFTIMLRDWLERTHRLNVPPVA